MNSRQIRQELDSLIEETTTFNEASIPSELLLDLKKWKWGSYGWVSPASLMFTAAWRKYYYPEIDCCKIWADDEKKNPIPGGYSIRTEDENISIPLLAKYDLCAGFCSPNSGMQGSRAIEKMRSLKRLDTDFDNAQRTLFDLRLFATIMNRINTLSKEQLLELIKYFIVTAKGIKEKRIKENESLEKKSTASFNILFALGTIPDPELTKCVVAACLQTIYAAYGITISGVDDYKTAADARAGKPGDLTLERDEKPVIAVEVKDKTQHIDWNNIERAKRIIAQHDELASFLFVLESRDAATDSKVNEMVNSAQLRTGSGILIGIVSLHDLHRMALAIASETDLINLTSKYLSIAPAVKPETKAMWLKCIENE